MNGSSGLSPRTISVELDNTAISAKGDAGQFRQFINAVPQALDGGPEIGQHLLTVELRIDALVELPLQHLDPEPGHPGRHVDGFECAPVLIGRVISTDLMHQVQPPQASARAVRSNTP